MSKNWPKVIRDPVHNIIPFEDNDCDRLLLDLINTKEFQRLRRIKQLGMSELVFPGANHSRFAHSIGVMHVGRRIMDQIDKLRGNAISPDHRVVVSVAALLHDIGHGPFSHSFEQITGQKHEVRTLEIIRSDETEVGKRLRSYDAALPERLAVFFDKSIGNDEREAADVPAFLTQVVTSQLDADRFDYLLRDCHATGTEYGRFDLDWIILQLRLDSDQNRFVIGRKGIDAAEAYVFARHHMYRSVYFHKTVRSAEVLLRLALKRYKELVGKEDSIREKQRIVPDLPESVFAAFTTKPTLDYYISLDDSSLTEFFKACTSAEDKLLRSLGTGLVVRKLYKSVDVSDSDIAQVEKFGNQARAIIKKARLDAEFTFIAETAADTPYKPYKPDSENPASQIYVENAEGKPIEISETAKGLQALREKMKFTRYYFPESVRDMIENVANATLREDLV